MKVASLFVVCLCSIISLSAVDAAIVTYTPFLDSDTEPNTSSTTPYAHNTTQTGAPAGVPDGTMLIHSDTFYYNDSGTGIDFNFDVQWTAVGGNLNGSTTTLGVGSSNDVGAGETLTVTLSNLQIDFTNYISGSVGSITTPQLDSSSLSFYSIGFADRTDDNANDSIVDINGSSLVNWGTAAGGVNDNLFVFDADGLTDSETTITLSHNAGSMVDTDFSLAFTRMNVVFEISEATAVPEPSALLPLLTIAAAMVRVRRKRRVSTNSL